MARMYVVMMMMVVAVAAQMLEDGENEANNGTAGGGESYGSSSEPGGCVFPYRFKQEGIWGPGVYANRSQQAHRVIGVMLIIGVLAWAGFVMQRLRLGSAYLLSGMSLVAAGLYLGLWVIIFSAPSHVMDGALWKFALKDLVQQQHLAISALAISGGILEILWWAGGARRPGRLTFRNDIWHILWTLNMMYIGIMFLTHPQHDHARGTIIHTFLGLCMAWAAVFLLISKLKGFPVEIENDFTVLLSGVSQIIACVLLVSYSEHSEGDSHTGVEARCHGAWPVTLGGYTFAILTQLIVVFHVLRFTFPAAFACCMVGCLDYCILGLDTWCALGTRLLRICTHMCFLTTSYFCPCCVVAAMQLLGRRQNNNNNNTRRIINNNNNNLEYEMAEAVEPSSASIGTENGTGTGIMMADDDENIDVEDLEDDLGCGNNDEIKDLSSSSSSSCNYDLDASNKND